MICLHFLLSKKLILPNTEGKFNCCIVLSVFNVFAILIIGTPLSRNQGKVISVEVNEPKFLL
jgi:hypothetical protein